MEYGIGFFRITTYTKGTPDKEGKLGGLTIPFFNHSAVPSQTPLRRSAELEVLEHWGQHSLTPFRLLYYNPLGR